MFIATLPQVYRKELMEEIIAHPLIGGVRYNTGYSTPYSPKETLEKIVGLTSKYNKKLWIDLKGRQLRINEWADPNYAKIVLNHEIDVELPAHVHFRGNESSNIKIAKDNVIYVEPIPRHAVGRGQAINIHGKDLRIKGYLTEDDRLYIQAACELGIKNFMLSFVESLSDITDANEEICKSIGGDDPQNKLKGYELSLKIESLKGLDFINNELKESIEALSVVVACDDLFVNIGANKVNILRALESMLRCDENAVAASRIFSGLETGKEVALSDFSHLLLLKNMGYKNFMLSDGICGYHFSQAMEALSNLKEIYPDF